MDPENSTLLAVDLSNLIQTSINHQVLLNHCTGKGMQGQKDHLLPDLRELHIKIYTYPLKYQAQINATVEVYML